jgi:hypothetical protein
MMHDLPIPHQTTYLIVKICVLILGLLILLAITAAPVA